MNIEQEKMIVESLPSLYPMQKFEEDAIKVVLDALPHWIPVTERPISKGLVLVTYNDGDVDLLNQPTAYRRGDIVAWMPLPKPYKGVTT